MIAEVVTKLRELGAELLKDEDTSLLTLDDELTVFIVIARHRAKDAGFSRWVIRFDNALMPDITIAVRMAPENSEI